MCMGLPFCAMCSNTLDKEKTAEKVSTANEKLLTFMFSNFQSSTQIQIQIQVQTHTYTKIHVKV